VIQAPDPKGTYSMRSWCDCLSLFVQAIARHPMRHGSTRCRGPWTGSSPLIIILIYPSPPYASRQMILQTKLTPMLRRSLLLPVLRHRGWTNVPPTVSPRCDPPARTRPARPSRQPLACLGTRIYTVLLSLLLVTHTPQTSDTLIPPRIFGSKCVSPRLFCSRRSSPAP
jgi:hypothetical protein